MLAASGAFWLKPTIYSANLISLGLHKIVVRGFSDDCCYSTTYPGHIETLWTFWECFVKLPLVDVTKDWQVAQLWLGHKNGGDKTLWPCPKWHPKPSRSSSESALYLESCVSYLAVYSYAENNTNIKKIILNYYNSHGVVCVNLWTNFFFQNDLFMKY